VFSLSCTEEWPVIMGYACRRSKIWVHGIAHDHLFPTAEAQLRAGPFFSQGFQLGPLTLSVLKFEAQKN
jgi:hypothetical protein